MLSQHCIVTCLRCRILWWPKPPWSYPDQWGYSGSASACFLSSYVGYVLSFDSTSGNRGHHLWCSLCLVLVASLTFQVNLRGSDLAASGTHRFGEMEEWQKKLLERKWIRQLNNQMTRARNTLRLTDLNELDEWDERQGQWTTSNKWAFCNVDFLSPFSSVSMAFLANKWTRFRTKAIWFNFWRFYLWCYRFCLLQLWLCLSRLCNYHYYHFIPDMYLMAFLHP